MKIVPLDCQLLNMMTTEEDGQELKFVADSNVAHEQIINCFKLVDISTFDIGARQEAWRNVGDP